MTTRHWSETAVGYADTSPCQRLADAARAELGPHGTMRVAINAANTIAAQIGPNGSLEGSAIDTARAIGERVGLPVAFQVHDSAGAIVATADAAQWDIAFLAFDPSREHLLHFTPPYKEIAASFAVTRASGMTRTADLDRSDIAIACASGAAYGLRLRRVMTKARIIECPSPEASLDLFLSEGAAAVAGVRDQLARFVAVNPAARLVEDDFAMLGQAIAVRRDRTAAARFLDDWIGSEIGKPSRVARETA